MQSWLKKIDRYTRICVTVFHRIIRLSNQLLILKRPFSKIPFCKILHCFQFLLRLTIALREIENSKYSNYAQFWRDN